MNVLSNSSELQTTWNVKRNNFNLLIRGRLTLYVLKLFHLGVQNDTFYCKIKCKIPIYFPCVYSTVKEEQNILSRLNYPVLRPC